jgi:hypothetical protein
MANHPRSTCRVLHASGKYVTPGGSKLQRLTAIEPILKLEYYSKIQARTNKGTAGSESSLP